MSVLGVVKNRGVGSIRKRPPTNIDLYLSVKLTDRDGRCVYRRRYKSHSFVVGFLNMFYFFWNNGFTTIGHASLVVGNGTGTAHIGDGGLASQIGNGTGSNQLEYGNVTTYGVTVNTSTNTAYFQIQEPFVNGSGSNVTVTEVGMNIQLSNGTNYFVAHDFLPQSISVGANQTLTVTYTIQVAT